DRLQEPVDDPRIGPSSHRPDPDRLPSQRPETAGDVDVVLVSEPPDQTVRVHAGGRGEARDRVRQEVRGSEGRETELAKPVAQPSRDLRVTGDAGFEAFLLQEKEGALEREQQ